MTVENDSRVKTLIAEATASLMRARIEEPRREARILFEIAYGHDISWQMMNPDSVMPNAQSFFALVQRRADHEPVAYLKGEKGFWTLDLEVTRDTLIPRGDTETLIEALIRYRPDRASVSSVLDLGTGSGCLLLAALIEYPQAMGVGVDYMEGTARQAAHNATLNQLDQRAFFIVAEWMNPLAARFDVVLSNPPYIPSRDIGGLMRDVADYEPMIALDGGTEGLDAYRAIIPRLPDVLTPEGIAILEFGIGQAEDVQQIAQSAGLKTVELCSDLAGVTRAIVLSRSF
ncbi:peptide chain release factor N(5)-glutamine methyltransferase [Acetobacter sp.]|uniref:peptide chain release factor N(5)-glutamine methyltransferase n=1 Tax=Acetobacter sp. TaxID=440 RepID=UPI0039EC84F2